MELDQDSGRYDSALGRSSGLDCSADCRESSVSSGEWHPAGRWLCTVAAPVDESVAGWAGCQIGTAIYNVTEYPDPGYFEDMIEYFGNLWSVEVLPTGTVTVGDPIDLGGVSGGWDDFDDFDICIEGITC